MPLNDRVRLLNSAEWRADARYVLYWAQMNRRVESNHALAFAVQLANERNLPVLVYEGITCSYPFASDRLHTFLLEGVSGIASALDALGIGYVFYLRRRNSDRNDVLYDVAKEAAALVTDDYPTFIARGHNAGVPSKIHLPYYVVDSSCVVPMRVFQKREWAAYTIRPKIQRLLPQYLEPVPKLNPRCRYRGPQPGFHTHVTPSNISELVAACEIDHSIPPSLSFRGGADTANRYLEHFLHNKLRRYAKERNEPSAHVTSGLSPYLHFGHISALRIALAAQEYAREHHLIADEFLEELIVRRELAFNFALFTAQLDSTESLPDWARTTLAKHATDPRSPLYTPEQLERAETHDDLWNATQKELLLRGTIHGYYRMYWGKKILEWSRTHEEAVKTMVYLHDLYAVDGRDPNTYANILWCLGLHDRPFPERAIFGQVRYMSYDGMKRKTNVAAYLKEIEYLERTGKDPVRL